MIVPDIINAGFEFGAGFAVLHHCRVLHRHKQARGVSPLAVLFFCAWGVWNLFYYPFLGQTWSFLGGLFVTAANGLYVGMLWVYGSHRQISADQLFVGMSKISSGYRPGDELWSPEDQEVWDYLVRATLAPIDLAPPRGGSTHG